MEKNSSFGDLQLSFGPDVMYLIIQQHISDVQIPATPLKFNSENPWKMMGLEDDPFLLGWQNLRVYVKLPGSNWKKHLVRPQILWRQKVFVNCVFLFMKVGKLNFWQASLSCQRDKQICSTKLAVYLTKNNFKLHKGLKIKMMFLFQMTSHDDSKPWGFVSFRHTLSPPFQWHNGDV